MSIFDKLGSAQSTDGRNPFIAKPGTTIDSIVRIRAGETREGVEFFAADLRVEKVVSNATLSGEVVKYNADSARKPGEQVGVDPHQPGEEVTFYVKLAAPYLDNKLGNVKNFCEAALDAVNVELEAAGIEVFDYNSADFDWAEAIMDPEKGMAANDGTAFAGQRLIRQTEPRISKNGGLYFVSTFAMAPADD